MPSKKGSKKAIKKNEEEKKDAIVVDSEHEMDDNADAANDHVADEPMDDANNDANDAEDPNVADNANDGDGADGASNEMDEDGDEDENEADDENDENDENEQDDENEEENDGNEENDESGGGSKKSEAKRAKKRRGGGGGAGGGRGRGKAKARDNRYRVYLFKILQQVHPKVGITKTAMDIMNSFIEDMFEKICTEAMKLCAYNKTSTIGAREIATATKLILPGELLKHALLEGEKAVQKFEKNSKALQARREKARGGKKGVFPGRKK